MNEPRKQIAAREGIDRQMVDRVVNRAVAKLGAYNLIDAFRALGWLRPGG